MWKEFANQQKNYGYFINIINFLKEEYKNNIVFPLVEDLFRIFDLIKLEDVRIIVIGQEPYSHVYFENKQVFAHSNGIPFDTHCEKKTSQYNLLMEQLPKKYKNIEDCIKNGYLFLNNIWTVRYNEPNSHMLSYVRYDILMNELVKYIEMNNKRDKYYISYGHPLFNADILNPNSTLIIKRNMSAYRYGKIKKEDYFVDFERIDKS